MNDELRNILLQMYLHIDDFCDENKCYDSEFNKIIKYLDNLLSLKTIDAGREVLD